MREFHDIVQDVDSADRAMKKLDPDFGGFRMARYDSIVLELLRKLVGDTSESSWISYYICDLKWGKSPFGKVVVAGKHWAKLDTPEKLFDIITHDNATSNG